MPTPGIAVGGKVCGVRWQDPARLCTLGIPDASSAPIAQLAFHLHHPGLAAIRTAVPSRTAVAPSSSMRQGGAATGSPV